MVGDIYVGLWADLLEMFPNSSMGLNMLLPRIPRCPCNKKEEK